MTYHWQQEDWPGFCYDSTVFGDRILRIHQLAGKTSGIWSALPRSPQDESLTDLMLTEALQTSRIEGELLNREDVRSSLRRELGWDEPRSGSPKAKGIAEIMVDLHRTWNAPLTEEQLFAWHRKLHATGAQGCWRSGEEPMQVISGLIDEPTVWYEAPPSCRVPNEMDRFITAFREQAAGIGAAEAPVWAALVHLWFESIHPFDDGNGRIGRALAEKALSIGMGGPQLISLSDAILEDKSDYYEQLRQAQQGNPITDWVLYFLDLILTAQRNSLTRLNWVVAKTRYFDTYGPRLNERQTRAVARMFAAGPEGFEGGMTTRKYAKLTQCSKPTATRDLTELTAWGALTRTGAGRSVRYDLPEKGDSDAPT